MFTHAIIHYGEIGIKKGNRPMFEKALARNIRLRIPGVRLKRAYGRFVVDLEGGNLMKTKEALKSTFGIANFSFARYAGFGIDSIKAVALDLASEKKGTFCVRANRADKGFPLTSMQVNEQVGEAIYNQGRKVDLKNPDFTVYVEIFAKSAFVYSYVEEGPGGLPVGSSGKVISMISGGIDSPVAAYMAMKRGCKCVLVHFHNYTLYQESVKKKIMSLVESLSRYNGKTRLYVVPFADIQSAIVRSIPSEYRMIAYRRAMLRIAERIRQEENAKAFVTGDNLGQVASQTLENLDAIYSASSKPIIAPLIGFDKKDIIKMAEALGTYETSILPYNDCCSAFVALHPATKASKEDLEAMESSVDFIHLEEAALKRAERLEFSS